MKILLQILLPSEILDLEIIEDPSTINYAIIEISNEDIQYLAQRRALFIATQQFADDLASLSFYECSFITFYNDLDLASIIETDKCEQGYWVLPNDFETDKSSVEAESIMLILDDESWYISAINNDLEIRTTDIKFSILGPPFEG